MRDEKNWRVRAAVPDDVETVARVHVAAYRETYRGMMPAEELERITVALSASGWGQVIAESRETKGVSLQVAVHEGRIVGLGTCCPQRSLKLRRMGYDGEISSLYVLPAFQGLGAGHALAQTLATQLRGAGFRAMALWTLAGNLRARAFYERFGGVARLEREEPCAGGALVEVAYGWDDVSALRSA
ncbi:N-acetyltransferase family protein [Camelimonas sp. ID_303_24]